MSAIDSGDSDGQPDQGPRSHEQHSQEQHSQEQHSQDQQQHREHQPSQKRLPIPPPPPAAAASANRGGQGNRLTDPSFPEDIVQVTAWPDPVLDRLGHDPRSGYVEQFWLSILGPSCLLLLRRLSAELERAPDGFELATVQWASELGIGMKGGKNGPLWRAIERGCRFGAARRNGTRLAVRRRLPPLTSRQAERLPLQLQAAHEQWTEARLIRQRRPTIVKWSPQRSNETNGEYQSLDGEYQSLDGEYWSLDDAA
ncbi:MAG: hypothetical protein ACRBK7_09965 [Acidimicrobiales bacterium]